MIQWEKEQIKWKVTMILRTNKVNFFGTIEKKR